ncbi:MAG TPA: amino acid permease, partial [Methanoregula sp.]|nr:amino acid permease [Methanoregula sp.]
VLLISSGAMIATASVLLTTIMGISRIVFAMARNNDLPAFLSTISPRFCTPHYAIVMTGAFMILTILAADLSLVVAVSTLTMLISYFIANISALRLPLRYQRYPRFVPVIGAISCAGLVVFLTINAWIIGIIGVAIGLVWYVIHKRITK